MRGEGSEDAWKSPGDKEKNGERQAYSMLVK